MLNSIQQEVETRRKSIQRYIELIQEPAGYTQQKLDN